MEYTKDGGLSWQEATPGTGGDGTDELETSPFGTPHAFVWDSGSDLGLLGPQTVKIRITPYLGDQEETPTQTCEFRVNDYAIVIPN